MGKLRLEIDSLKVESFAAEPDPGKSGTVHGRDDSGGWTIDHTRCNQTCDLADTCYGCSGDFCSAYCTGLGTGCYTNDPVYYACTGQDPCTGAGPACTNTTCTGYC